VFAELLAFLCILGDVGEGLWEAEWVKDGHAEPILLTFRRIAGALLLVFRPPAEASTIEWPRNLDLYQV
jgi:hypothetical protein